MLGERLLLCAKQVRPGSRAADIGTDHARLPVYLVSNGVCPRVIAADLRPGPLAAAKRSVEAAGLSDKIPCRQGFGLDVLDENEADDIVVAGMGGELIAEIISRAPWVKSGAYRLILQPMTKPQALRARLFSEGFEILREAAAREAGRLYTVITARYSGEKRGARGAEIYIGGLAGSFDENARLYLEQQAKRLKTRLRGLERSGAPAAEAGRLKTIYEAVRRAAQAGKGGNER